jgi:hypothetical protein
VQAPAKVQVPVQTACVVTVQVPAGAQQEPVGGGHGFGVQAPAEVQVPVHAACVVTVQVPAGAQQEPFGGGAVSFLSPSHPAPPTINAIATRIRIIRIANPP